MIDTITVVFEPELDILKKQAQSIDLYVDNVDSIMVILNDDALSENQIHKSWWGRYQNQVRVIHRNRFGQQWNDNGWLSQQVLKLLAAQSSATEWAIVLDAKTIFVESLRVLESMPAVGQLDVYPVFDPSRRIANELFGIELKQQLGPGGVPFVINTHQVQTMIDWITQHVSQDFATWFQSQGLLTEFILYSAWIQYHAGSLSAIYNVDKKDLNPINVCHNEVALFDQKLREMHTASTVSIHRNAWNQLTQNQQQQYIEFLHSRGIQ